MKRRRFSPAVLTNEESLAKRTLAEKTLFEKLEQYGFFRQFLGNIFSHFAYEELQYEMGVAQRAGKPLDVAAIFLDRFGERLREAVAMADEGQSAEHIQHQTGYYPYALQHGFREQLTDTAYHQGDLFEPVAHS